MGTSTVTFKESSQSNGTASVMGARPSSLRGRIEPMPTNAARPSSGSLDLMESAFSAVSR